MAIPSLFDRDLFAPRVCRLKKNHICCLNSCCTSTLLETFDSRLLCIRWLCLRHVAVRQTSVILSMSETALKITISVWNLVSLFSDHCTMPLSAAPCFVAAANVSVARTNLTAPRSWLQPPHTISICSYSTGTMEWCKEYKSLCAVPISEELHPQKHT